MRVAGARACPREGPWQLSQPTAVRSGLVVAERGGSPAAALGRPSGGEVLVVVGPEGGLTPAEVEQLRPWARLGLGPHVLRAETAALAAAAVLGPGRRPPVCD